MTSILLAPVHCLPRLIMFGKAIRNFEYRGWRRIVWVARKANTEPTELLVAISMICGAWALLARPDVGPLVFPAFFGWALLWLGVFGLVGLCTRAFALRVIFSFGGVVFRTWMASLYCLRDWHDPAWIAFMIGALACAWISIRIVCDAVARKVRLRVLMLLENGD